VPKGFKRHVLAFCFLTDFDTKLNYTHAVIFSVATCISHWGFLTFFDERI